MKYFLLVSILSISAVSLAGPAYDQLTKGLPKDVIKMIDRRIGCNYWSAELPNDATGAEARESGRPQMIEKKLKELNCSRLEKDEAAMKVKYKKKNKIISALDDSTGLSPAD